MGFLKKRLSLIKLQSLMLCVILAASLFTFTGCQGNVQNNGKINIVCTTYPQYNWIQNIIGEESEEFNLTLLVDGGADLHSYQPSAKDMAKISSADMFVYVGGSSDAWVFDAVRETVNKNMKKVNMMELLGDRAKEEEVVEGMQDDEHGHSHTASEDSHGEHEETDEIEYDEHIWLSVKNAEILVQKLTLIYVGDVVVDATAYPLAGVPVVLTFTAYVFVSLFSMLNLRADVLGTASTLLSTCPSLTT